MVHHHQQEFDTVDFEKWKGICYHNWGYTHWKNGKMVIPHIMWFENAISKTNVKNN